MREVLEYWTTLHGPPFGGGVCVARSGGKLVNPSKLKAEGREARDGIPTDPHVSDGCRVDREAASDDRFVVAAATFYLEGVNQVMYP